MLLGKDLANKLFVTAQNKYTPVAFCRMTLLGTRSGLQNSYYRRTLFGVEKDLIAVAIQKREKWMVCA